MKEKFKNLNSIVDSVGWSARCAILCMLSTDGALTTSNLQNCYTQLGDYFKNLNVKEEFVNVDIEGKRGD